jgi:hypothetical protein
MPTTVIDLKIKLSSLIESYEALGISIKQIRKEFIAHRSATKYLKKPRSDKENGMVRQKENIVNSTRENYKRYFKIVNYQNKIKKKQSEERYSPILNIVSPIDESGCTVSNQHNTLPIEPRQNEIIINDRNYDQNNQNNEHVNGNGNNSENITDRNTNAEQIETEQQEIDNDDTQSDDIPEDSQCQNCKRRQHNSLHDRYKLQFFTVNSTNIRIKGDFKLVTAYTGERAVDYVFCKECKSYLEEKNDDPKNVWPCFYWLLLTGSHKSSFNGTTSHHSVYGGNVLWMFISQQMRYWWIDEILALTDNNNSFESVTISHPPSIFEDKTIALSKFNEDFATGQLSNMPYIQCLNSIFQTQVKI